MRHVLKASSGFCVILFATRIALADDTLGKDKAKSEMEALMTHYIQLWNAYDAAAIEKQVYRLDPGHPWSTEAGLKAEFDRLRSQGYLKSEMSSITGCALGPDIGRVELRYTRWKTDGSFMPPKDRASVYELKRFADGWRAVGIKGLAADAKMECP
jgi:hypothetical protein